MVDCFRISEKIVLKVQFTENSPNYQTSELENAERLETDYQEADLGSKLHTLF